MKSRNSLFFFFFVCFKFAKGSIILNAKHCTIVSELNNDRVERYQFIKVNQFNKLAAHYQVDDGFLAANSAAERLLSTAGDKT